MSLYTDLSAAVASVTLDAGLFRSITQGPATGAGSIVTTEGGDVWTLAKAVDYVTTSGDAAIATFNTNGAGAITLFNTNAATALDDLQAAIAAISGDVDAALKSVPNTFTSTNTFNGVTLVAAAATTADTTNAVNVTMLRTFAAKKAANPTNALPGEAVDGADIRVNATGGMRQSGGGASSDPSPAFPRLRTPNLYNLAAPFDYLVTVKGLAHAAAISGLLDSEIAGLTVYTQGDDLKVSRSAEVLIATATGVVPVGSPLYGDTFRTLRISYDGATLSVYVGTALIHAFTLDLVAEGITPQKLIPLGGYTTNCLDAEMRRIRTANFALTTDEAEGAAKGESRGRLVHTGYGLDPTSWESGAGGSTLSAVTADGFTCDVTAGNNITKLARPVCLSRPVPVGQTCKLLFDVVLNSGNATDLPGLALWQTIFEAQSGALIQVGANEFTMSPYAPSNSGALVFCRHTGVGWAGATTGAVNFTVSNIRVVFEGTVANYAPENCLASNDWIDVSGNCYDLVAVGGAKANNPAEGYVRVCTVTTASGASVGASAQASVGTITGNDSFATAVIATLKQWAAVFAVRKSAPASNIKRGVVAEVASAGALTIYAEANATGGTEAANTTYELTVNYK